MMRSLVLAAVLLGASAPVQQIAHGVAFIAGDVPQDRGPDGNSVVFDAPEGLVVVDTGRHVAHSDAILDLAAARSRPIAAIINTHWHLDHSSGNRRIKAAFPGARVFATNAIDRALAPGGFLARSYANALAHRDDADVSDVQREEREGFLATMAASAALRPDTPLTRPGLYRFGGRRFVVHLTHGAVTDSDVWLYDPRTRVAVLGDLVTLPAPFFETACPQQWRAALDDVWAAPFRIAIPGHGQPMSPAQFNIYRIAFGQFVDCANSDQDAGACARDWTRGVSVIMTASEAAQAEEYAAYYVGFLRDNHGKSPGCLTN